MINDVLGYLARVVIFLIAGPIVGGALFAFMAPLGGSGGIKGALLAGYFTVVVAFPLFLVGCYMLGWKAALAAGLILGLIGPWMGSRSLFLAVSASVGAIAAVTLQYGEKAGPISLLGFIGAVSAVACVWFLDRVGLMRSWHLPLA